MTSLAEIRTFYHVYLHIKWPVSAAQQHSCHGKTLRAWILVKTQSARRSINRRIQIFSLGSLNIRVHVFFYGFFPTSLFCPLRGWRQTPEPCSHSSPLEERLAEWTMSLVFIPDRFLLLCRTLYISVRHCCMTFWVKCYIDRPCDLQQPDHQNKINVAPECFCKPQIDRNFTCVYVAT